MVIEVLNIYAFILLFTLFPPRTYVSTKQGENSVFILYIDNYGEQFRECFWRCQCHDLSMNISHPDFNLIPKTAYTRVTDAQHYLFSGKQCVDVFHSIEICSIQGVLAGENLQNKMQAKNPT